MAHRHGVVVCVAARVGGSRARWLCACLNARILVVGFTPNLPPRATKPCKSSRHTRYAVLRMYAYVPIWAKSTSRGEVEGPNGGLRTRCGLSSFTLCSFRVLITYLWWVDIKRLY